MKRWFNVISTKDVKTAFGPTKILTLRDRDGTLFNSWSTTLINQTIDTKMARGGTLFIKSLGKKKTKSGKKKFYDIKYKLMQQKKTYSDFLIEISTSLIYT